MRVVLSDAADDDLEAIARHVAADNPGRALSFIQELQDACAALGDLPRAWPLVPRYERHGLRRRVYGNYLIFFRVESAQTTILRILHGARDYETILFPDS